jgi:catechol 2,3-dioxygenase-like lactoylglutathione lyase family enzyme
VGVTVADMERSVQFYSGVLSFEKVSDVEVTGSGYEHLQGVFGLRIRVVRMRLGEEYIELTEYLAPRGRPIPIDSRSHDGWFQHMALVVSDIDHAYLWLRRHRVEHASSGPQRLPEWNPNAGGIQAFYFKDPDGHPLEILQFPPEKGADTEASLRFYRDTLGLKVESESENYGTEQEQLNNVFGARLRITTLRAAKGSGIECLEYLTPHDGRPMPADVRANDLMHWQTTLVTRNIARAARALFAGKFWWVSPGTVTLAQAHLGFVQGILVRDPDGHAMQVIER